MSYSDDPRLYREEELRRVAELRYIQGLSHAEIEKETNIRPRQKITAMCRAARKANFVRAVMMPSPTVREGRLRDLEDQVCERFGLLACRLVNGRQEMLTKRLEDNIRQVILDDMARATATFLEIRAPQIKEMCLAISYGFVARKVADALRSSPETYMPGGLVLAAQGVRKHEMDRFDANDIVRDIAREFGCRYACMPIPAVVNEEYLDFIQEMPLVKGILEKLQNQTNIAFGSIASLHQEDWLPDFDSLGNDLFSKDDQREIAEAGGIGNFGDWWFGIKGDDISYTKKRVVGMGLERLRELVQQNKPVIVAVGAHATRIPALAVALKHRLVNVWIGDEWTARVLMGTLIKREDIRWTEEEKEILDELSVTAEL